MKKYIFSLAVLAMLMGASQVKAQNFDDYFVDKTLRVDYTFAGNSDKQLIAVDELNVLPRWYGKKQRLSELPVEGNGQITVRDHRSGKVIYRNSFSTLFQEWLSYPEAAKNTQSFENVFLVPMPKDTVDITLDLRNNRREIMTSLTHQVAPKDILIHHKGDNPTPYETLQAAAGYQQVHPHRLRGRRIYGRRDAYLPAGCQGSQRRHLCTRAFQEHERQIQRCCCEIGIAG